MRAAQRLRAAVERARAVRSECELYAPRRATLDAWVEICAAVAIAEALDGAREYDRDTIRAAADRAEAAADLAEAARWRIRAIVEEDLVINGAYAE